MLFLITFAINSLAGRLVGVEGCGAHAGRHVMSRQQTHRLAVVVLTIVAAMVVIPIILVILYVVWQGLARR